MTHPTISRSVPRRVRASSASTNWWSIVLAGGKGARLQGWVRECFGVDRPKQYCAVIGTRSMLQHTLDRADAVTVSDQKITVIAEEHRIEAIRQMRDRRGVVVAQPRNRDTAAGIFLPLLYVRHAAPHSTVIVLSLRSLCGARGAVCPGGAASPLSRGGSSRSRDADWRRAESCRFRFRMGPPRQPD